MSRPPEAGTKPVGVTKVSPHAGATPTPRYADVETQRLSEEIEAARIRKENLQTAGLSTAEADREILALRRQLREGGRLKAGDSLGSGRYLLLDRLGRGGFAIVWRAYDQESKEEVAIKVLHSELAGDKTRVERFFRGARIMAELEHPALVHIRERCGEDGGYCYFVMDLIAGSDFQHAVIEKRPSEAEIISAILHVGDALGHAHAKGIIHRDVKPANILLDASGAPWLTDFDLVGGAHTTGGTRTGAMGTFLYAAPEVMDRPQDADARADVYGLGMTAVFGLHRSNLPMSVVQNPKAFIDKLACNDPIKSVLKRAVDWNKSERFADANEFCDALRAAFLPAAPPPRLEERESPDEPLGGDVELFIPRVVIESEPSDLHFTSTSTYAVNADQDPTGHTSHESLSAGAPQSSHLAEMQPFPAEAIGINKPQAPVVGVDRRTKAVDRRSQPRVLVVGLLGLLGLGLGLGVWRLWEAKQNSTLNADTNQPNDPLAIPSGTPTVPPSHSAAPEMASLRPDVDASAIDAATTVILPVESATRPPVTPPPTPGWTIAPLPSKTSPKKSVFSAEPLSLGEPKSQPESTTPPVTSIPPPNEAAIRKSLEPKVWSGKASIDEIRQLKAICSHMGDRACRDRANAMLKQKQSGN